MNHWDLYVGRTPFYTIQDWICILDSNCKYLTICHIKGGGGGGGENRSVFNMH